jgi:Zn-dependent peptidase ImmA (M78 family)/DNA-binding XRE family transcriptional regulator
MNQLFSEKFKAARVLNGLSLQDLSDKLNKKVSRQALHKYEKGEVVPDSEMIGLLSEALKVRPDFFFRETKVDLGPIEFRKLTRLPAKEENKLVEQVRDQLSRYLELEEIIALESSFENPVKGLTIHSFDDADNAAQMVRKAWKLGCDPIFNCIELLEDNNIKVIEVESNEAFDGMQTWINGNIPVIAINTAKIKSGDRKRFTVLHELAHLLLSFFEGITSKEKEKYCHQFAGAMLLPKETAIKELGLSRNKLMIQELGALKMQYGISIQAIVVRARDLKIISESYYTQFFFYINQMGWRAQEPYTYEGVEESYRFKQLLFRALAEELISISKAASLNNQTVAEFREKSLMVA